jgi:hypothetical protein
VERRNISKAWIGRTVRARIRIRRGGQYIVLGKLVEVNEESIKIMAGSRSADESDLRDARRYPWDRIVTAACVFLEPQRNCFT